MKACLYRRLVLGFLSLTLGSRVDAGSPGVLDSLPPKYRTSPSSRIADAALSKWLGPGFSTHTTDHFFLAGAQTCDGLSDIGIALETTHVRFYRAFGEAGFILEPHRDRLVWIFFADHGGFDEYARCADTMNLSWLDGYYSARTNRVAVVATDAFKAAHEAAHQLAFNTGLQKRGVMYPIWVSEGLATNLESWDVAVTDRTVVTRPGGHPSTRARRLQALLAGGRLLPLDDFVALSRAIPGRSQSADELYAQAWALFRFLFWQRTSDLRNYLSALARIESGWRDDHTLRREFVEAFGSIPALDRPWKNFLTEIVASPYAATVEFDRLLARVPAGN